jgi:aromatic-L-amino-acid/L-tryptophan decarboxylase
MDDFRKAADEVCDWIDDYLKNSSKFPVLSQIKPGDIRNALPAEPPVHAEPFSKVMQDFQKIILPGVTHWNHPGFFSYFAITGSAPGVLGEMLSAALNINGMLWRTCPAATELEELTLDWLRQMIGLPANLFGIIMDTASVGSLCAIAAARESLNLGIREQGMAGRTDLPRLRVYTSQQSHSSIEKGAIVLGFGQQGVRQIPVDESFRMRADALDSAIQEDLQNGWKPTCVVATVGTTSTASVDPVPEIAKVCKKYGVWLHVDAAYAGSAAILPEMNWIMKGCDQADSFLFNPHKWLFVPFDCTAFYTKHPKLLAQTFSLVPEYLRTPEEGIHNFMDYGIQLGRRFRALKLWMVIRMFGVEGLQKAVRRHIQLAKEFADWIDASSHFERVAPVHFSLVCFRAQLPGYSEEELNRLNQNLTESINRSGDAFLYHTKLNGKITLRLAIGNLQTEKQHVDRVRQLLEEALELEMKNRASLQT